jgi:hypothetical protein
MTETWDETCNVTQERRASISWGSLASPAATVHALASLAHTTWVHSAIHRILHKILHGILLWYCPNYHKKMEKLALL